VSWGLMWVELIMCRIRMEVLLDWSFSRSSAELRFEFLA
jgi:hypothetical protein